MIFKNLVKKIKFSFLRLYRYSIFEYKISRSNEYFDFLVFPFEINKPMSSSAFDIMKKGVSILEKMDIEYCLADGTLLGIFRDNCIIPHDTDIDVAVLHPVNTLGIERQFKRNGFKVGRKVVVDKKVQQIVFYTQDEVLFDIIFYTKIGTNVYAFPESDFYFKHLSNHYEKFVQKSFKNYDFYLPQYTELWLEHVYGKNWNIPKSTKPNDWREGGNEYLTAVPYSGNTLELIKKIKSNEVD
jgi:hypothetical protein